MADSLPDLVARLRATTPALADVPDDVLTAEVVRQLQARGGPSVGDALGEPVFRTSNEKDAAGAAVVRETPSAWTKAATIGAPGIGEHYTFPSVGEVLASDSPLQLLAQFVTGHGRPRTVANADPLGITAFHEGKAPPPMFLGTTEEVGNVLGAAVGDVLGAAGRGLYSRVDDAVSRLPVKGAHPNKIATLLKSNGATAEELAYRQVPEFLAAKGNATVTPGALQAHLDAHPAPFPEVKVLGGPNPAYPTSLPEGYSIQPLQGDRYERAFTLVGPDGSGRALLSRTPAEAQREAIAWIAKGEPATLSTQHASRVLPGGEQYRETLLTLPTNTDQILAEPRQAFDQANQALTAFRQANPDVELEEGLANPAYRQLLLARNRVGEQLTQQENAHAASLYHPPRSHFEEPNLLVHTRSNTRTLPTGEPGRFVEEVQSDWHQAGKEQGYQAPVAVQAEMRARYNELARQSEAADATWHRLQNDPASAGRPGTPERDAYLNAAGEVDRLRAEKAKIMATFTGGVPDAPFKDTWPDLGLKQQLLEAAKDPDAQWLGFTSGQTQAARYDLSKQVKAVHWYPERGTLEVIEHGNTLPTELAKNVTQEQLANYVGKEAASKLVTAPKMGGAHVLTGLDLQVGGEGMHHFYDELLPKRLQKIVKPFGGTVEQSAITAGIGENVHGTRALGEAFFDAAQPGSLINGKLPVGSSRRLFSRDELGEAFLSGRLNAFDMPNYLQDAVQQAGGVKEPAWIVRLTPAMKARILKEGLPLSLLLGAAAGPSVAEALGGDSNSPQ